MSLVRLPNSRPNESPEDRELAERNGELLELEARLVNEELSLASLTADIETFERRYFDSVGRLLVEMDILAVELARARLQCDPTNAELRAGLGVAEDRAAASAGAAPDAPSRPSSNPDEHTKALFRKIASLVHPDLTTDQKQKEMRTAFFADAHAAYRCGDTARLESLLRDWQHHPSAVEGGDVAHQLVRAIRRRAQIKERLREIAHEMQALRASEVFSLMRRVEGEREGGVDLLGTMASEADTRIAELKGLLAAMHRHEQR